jgi:hypothetical protein
MTDQFARHQVEFPDIRHLTMSQDLASTTGGQYAPSKRLQAQVVMADPDNNFKPMVKFAVYVAGEEKYLGADLKEAVKTYNEW